MTQRENFWWYSSKRACSEHPAELNFVLFFKSLTNISIILPVNLLILDEPTNHLDMKTKDILKSALKDFDGTLIVVSHDRDFLDGLVTKVYEFGNKKVTEHLEGIYEFLQRKKLENLQELERKN